jgi:hypothetical protein
MSDERDEREAQDEARRQGEDKGEDQRRAEEAYSQGGQDVEEAEHDAPGTGPRAA